LISPSRTTRTKLRRAKRQRGKQFVRYWLHAEHLLVEGEKMSKSLGNFFHPAGSLREGIQAFGSAFLRWQVFRTAGS